MGVSSYFGSCTDTEGSKSLHLESLEKLSGLAGNFSASTTGTLPIMRFFRDYFNSAFEPALEPALERLPLPSSFFGSSTLNPSMTEFTIHVHTVDILPQSTLVVPKPTKTLPSGLFDIVRQVRQKQITQPIKTQWFRQASIQSTQI